MSARWSYYEDVYFYVHGQFSDPQEDEARPPRHFDVGVFYKKLRILDERTRTAG